MLVYTENNNLITTSLGDPYENINLMSLHFEANHFSGKANRFYKIISEDSVSRDIRHISRESMNREAIRRFRQLTDNCESSEYYDKKLNTGYKVYPYMKGNPTIFTYSMIYPAITEFFQYWDNSNKNESGIHPISISYDLSSLFKSMDNFHDLSVLLLEKEGEQLKKSLYYNFPEFAIFYYEIYPYIKIETTGTYDIAKLIGARLKTYELGLETIQFDRLISNIPVAENNAKVLKLVKSSKENFRK